MSRKITEFTAVTAVEETDVVPLANTGVSRKITIPNLRSQIAGPWISSPSTHWTATPSYRQWDGSSFNTISARADSTAYSVGDFVRPAADNGYLYECVVAGTSHSSPPTWGTTLGADTSEGGGTVVWRARGLHVITANATLLGYLLKGSPIKYTVSSVEYYGMVVGKTSDAFAFAGAPLLGTQTITALSWGNIDRTIERRWKVAGTYGDGAADLLSADNAEFDQWGVGRAYLVRVGMAHGTDDTGAAQPKVNLKVSGNLILDNDTDAGMSVSETWAYSPPTGIKTANYQTVLEAPIEVRCTAAGSNSDASDLSVSATFVLE